jgi:hypothetical protein
MSPRTKCIAAALWYAACCAAEQRAAIRVWAETEDGQPIAEAVVRLVETGSGLDRSVAFSNLLARDVAFGTYDLSVSAPGFRKFDRKLSVFQDHIDVHAVLLVAEERTSVMVMRGSVRNMRGDHGNTWIYLIPLAGSPGAVLEARVDERGRFSLASPTSAPYLLLLLRGSRVLYQREIYFGHEMTPIDIQLR